MTHLIDPASLADGVNWLHGWKWTEDFTTLDLIAAGQKGQGSGQEHVTMTAEPAESPVTGGVRSLEVRWIFPGQLESAVAGWFGRFPAVMESREGSYLLDPPLPGLSVQVRGAGRWR